MTSIDTTRANPRANHSGILLYPPLSHNPLQPKLVAPQAYTPTKGPRYRGPSGPSDATGNATVPYEPSFHILNEKRGTKHARSSYSNPLIEEPTDFGHAPKYRKEIPSQSATSYEESIHYNSALQLTESPKICSYNHANFEGEESNIGGGEHNQAGFKCEPRNVVDARRELQLIGRYNNEDVALEL
ncbi:hypothetical protein H5410_004527 [Solanum commersonii]|uniref:Uncharacterized protein n=1 Tax=Solanum commersonii TaxID=4109 RepID=A0A9J6B893_SOLCO|nr:hypothetical protein H5410_004527 [Solanum commersonii]